jgi:carbonic anhydrase/acetyltransferase-like protein (isoleucine patch superfamily)
VIGRGCLVGAGAVVTEGKVFADHSLIIGSPAKAVREITPEQLERMKQGALGYVEKARRHRSQLKRIA